LSFETSNVLSCPLDGLPLVQDGKRLLCAHGHSFDIARQGYVNLLGASDKRSQDPGDSKGMVNARREFLDTGHYLPVANRLVDLLKPVISCNSVIVDAGCGEGYYLQQLQTQLESTADCQPSLIGFDISKWAVQAASRRLSATWLVASNRNIPVAANSADCVLSLFGFPVFESFKKALKEGGSLVCVNAGPRHLIELREIIYPEIKHSESTVVQQALAAGFTAGETSTLEFKTAALNREEIQLLLTMTPHLFRASHAGKERAAQLDQLAVTVDVIFQFLHKG
jgi:23S rRNA (guanine745-N1)-methyltransferase